VRRSIVLANDNGMPAAAETAAIKRGRRWDAYQHRQWRHVDRRVRYRRGHGFFHAKTLTTPHDLTQCFVEVLARSVQSESTANPRLDTLLEQVDLHPLLHDAGHQCRGTAQGSEAGSHRCEPAPPWTN